VLLAPFVVAGFGSGAFIPPNAQFIIATVDRSDAGAASGVVTTAQRIGSAIGIAVCSSLLFGSIAKQLGPDSGQRPQMGVPPPLPVQNAFITAAAHSILLAVALAVLAFALVFVLPRRVNLH
jgi:sugar phosphate permease